MAKSTIQGGKKAGKRLELVMRKLPWDRMIKGCVPYLVSLVKNMSMVIGYSATMMICGIIDSEGFESFLF